MAEKKQRIWELDALRGLCILGMIVVHVVFDLIAFGGLELKLPMWFHIVQQYGHIFFILISGLCVTLGSRSFRRGIIVFGAGLLVSYVTLFMDYVVGFQYTRIWFGILHMLGLSMMLYPLFRKFPHWALFLTGTLFVLLGAWLRTVPVSVPFLFPLGLCSPEFYSGSDFFPLFPGLGWFLLGAGLGKTLYRRQATLLPRVNEQFFLLRFLRFCGRHSLEIYLLHQPVAAGLVMIFAG